MPYTLQLEHLPAGFAATASLPGAYGFIEVCGFHTSDEGLDFTRRLEGCDVYLTGSPRMNPAQIDHLLAVIAPDRKATVYLNELAPAAKIQAKRGGIQAGEPVMLDDIADVIEFDIRVEIPPDFGVLFLFSWRWRKALFFDFQPLGPNPVARKYSVAAALAACYCRLVFSERFSLNDVQWERLMDQRWFPFFGAREK